MSYMMRSPRQFASLAGLMVGLFPLAAHADTSVHATAAFTAAYNDNIQGAPDDPPAGVAGPVAAVSLQPVPGLILYHDQPRSRFILSYAHPFTFYLGHPDADVSADIATAVGIFTLSPVEELNLGLAVNRFTASQSTLQGANQTTVAAQPQADTTVLTVGLSEGYSKQLTSQWSLLQTAGSSLSVPIGNEQPQPVVFNLDASSGPEYTFGNHAIAVLPSVTYTRPFYDEATDPTQTPTFQEGDQWTAGALARWRWDWTLSWSSELSGGFVVPFDGQGNSAFAPLAGAAIRYTEEGYSAALAYNRAMAPNLVTGQTFFSDTLALSGGVPLWREQDLVLLTSSGMGWNRVVDDGQNIDSDVVNTWLTDVAVMWQPDIYPSVALRYQRVQQFNAPDNQTLLPNFTRNVLSLTFGYVWPQRDMQVPTGPALRVDGGDRDPLAPGNRNDQPGASEPALSEGGATPSEAAP